MILFNSACIFHLLSYTVTAVCLRGRIQRESGTVKSDLTPDMSYYFCSYLENWCIARQQKKKNKSYFSVFQWILWTKNVMLYCELFLISCLVARPAIVYMVGLIDQLLFTVVCKVNADYGSCAMPDLKRNKCLSCPHVAVFVFQLLMPGLVWQLEYECTKFYSSSWLHCVIVTFLKAALASSDITNNTPQQQQRINRLWTLVRFVSVWFKILHGPWLLFYLYHPSEWASLRWPWQHCIT